MANDIVEEIKSKLDIVSVLEADGFHFPRKGGRYLTCREHDSLVVDMHLNAYHWNSQSESGDIFNWVMNRGKGIDFKAALELLARRAGVQLPQYGEKDVVKRLAVRAREEAFQVAQRVFARWLKKDKAAWTYAKGRGWSDEIIVKEGLGFSGNASAAELKEMGDEFALYGVDRKSAAAVAIMGWSGDVAAWKQAHTSEIEASDWNEDWVGWGRIPGMMSSKHPRLVYPSMYGGRVHTMTGRNLKLVPQGDDNGDHYVGDEERKSHNLPVALGGARRMYPNSVYGPRTGEVVIVEGPADKVTLAQWGIPALALGGTSWRDHEEYLHGMVPHKDDFGNERGHETIYIAVDSDEAGDKALRGKDGDFPLADVLGPMCRVVRFPEKDANDWLKAMMVADISPDRQLLNVRQVFDDTEPMVMMVARHAGGLKGAARDKAVERAVKVIARMNRVQLAAKRKDLAEAMMFQLREFNNLVSTERKEQSDEGDEHARELVPTLGGWYRLEGSDGKKGYLIEQLWDLQAGKGSLAWRDPDGHVMSGPYLDVNGYRYVAVDDDDIIRQGGVLFASEMGPLKETRELVGIIKLFLQRYFLLDNYMEYELASYYVLLTWLYDCFSAIPYLRAQGDTNTGKSELMLRIGQLCYRLVISTGASSTAALKFALNMYRGTIFMDEMDISDKFDDRMVILNVGAMRDQAKVWNMMPVIRPDGSQGYTGTIANVYGPKLITMYGRFKDPATEGRCLTFKMSEKEPIELKRKGIPTEKTKEFYAEAQYIRNLMVRWRLEHWQEQIELDQDLADMAVSTRINQVTMPIKWIAKYKSSDPQLLKDVEAFVQLMQNEQLLQKAMGLDARVTDAVMAVLYEADFMKYAMDGNIEGYGTVKYIQYKDLALVTNAIINEMNAGEMEKDEGSDESKKRRVKEVTSHTIGNICRNDLRLPVRRHGRGFVVILEPERIDLLRRKYGLGEVAISVQQSAVSQKAEVVTQGKLLDNR